MAAAAWIEKSWSDAPFECKDSLVAEFLISADVTGASPFARVEFFWQQNRLDRYRVESCALNTKTALAHTFANRVELAGWLKWVPLLEGRENDNGGIFGNLYLSVAGKEARWHYEGMMVTFHWGGVKPPGPLPPPEPPEPEPVEPEPVVVRQSEDLFPYIYMRTWPRIDERDLKLHFVDYAVGPSPAGPLYTALVDCRTVRGRAGAEQLAVDYIDGDAGWQGQFVADVRLLPGACGRFSALVRYARDLQEEDLPQVAAIFAEILDLPEEEWPGYLASPEYSQTLNRVQDSYFALLITLGYDQRDLQELTATLVGANLFTAFVRGRAFFGDAAVFRHLARASVILPRPLFPLPPYEASPPGAPQGQGGWIEPYAIGDLQMVRHRLLRYEPGEIAAIANVLKGERREVRTRHLQTASETVRDEAAGEERYDRDDQSVRLNLAAATEKTIADTVVRTDYDSGKGFKTTYGPPSTVTFEGSWSVETKGNPDEAGREAVARFARDILNRTINRVRRQIHRVRQVASASENEEVVVSVFDNVGGAHNITGVYRWLNKVYGVSVFRYGSRLMIELLIEQPAAGYIRNELRLRGISYVEPLPPEHFKVYSHEDVSPDNYAGLAAYYGVTDLEPPPLASRIVATVITANQTAMVALPPGYQAVKAAVKAALPAGRFVVDGLVGVEAFSLNEAQQGMEVAMHRELDAVPVSLTSALTLASPPAVAADCYLNVEIDCAPTAAREEQWQIATYGALLKGYHRREAAYYRQVASPEGGALPSPRSSLACRRIERSVLRQGCMELLLTRREELVGGTMPGPASSPAPMAVNRAHYLRFFENAFEWREMTYDFCLDSAGGSAGGSWANIGALAGDDELFARFLQASQARVMVPARPGHDLKVLYYLAAAMLMPGVDAQTPVHAGDVGVVNELKKMAPGGCESRDALPVSWEVVVPTTMQVLQAEGLPFATGPATVEEEP